MEELKLYESEYRFMNLIEWGFVRNEAALVTALVKKEQVQRQRHERAHT